MAQRHVHEQAFSGGEHAAFVKIRQESPGVGFGNTVTNECFQMFQTLFRISDSDLHDADKTMSSPLAFHNVAPFGCKPTAENVVDLAGHTTKTGGKLLAPKGKIGVLLFLQKVLNVGFDEFCQAGHGKHPFGKCAPSADSPSAGTLTFPDFSPL